MRQQKAFFTVEALIAYLIAVVAAGGVIGLVRNFVIVRQKFSDAVIRADIKYTETAEHRFLNETSAGNQSDL